MTSTAWQRSTPHKDRSSQAWKLARRAALIRDGYQCTAILDSIRCTHPAHEVDHIDQSNNHSLNNLAALCVDHHKLKTDQEKAAARWRWRERRPVEKHPGLINPTPVAEGTWG